MAEIAVVPVKELRDQILSSLPANQKAVNFLADAPADAVRLSAHTTAQSNTARRTLWLKNWLGDVP